jgi:hypothetical protein
VVNDDSVIQLLNDAPNSIFHWTVILNFFEEHKTVLSPYQKLLIYKKIERYRKTFLKQEHIERKDIYPYIYDDQIILEYERKNFSEE